MAVESVSGSCSEVNMFINDSSGDEQTYITHINDNYFHTKFKIDPNELYTFHDSDVIAGEITVSHTEDNMIFPDTVDAKTKFLESPSKELDLIGAFANGDIKDDIKKEVISNGHYSPTKMLTSNYMDVKTTAFKDIKTSNAKVPKAKSQGKEPTKSNSVTEIRRPSVHSPKGQNSNATALSASTVTSISNDNVNSISTSNSKTGMETFLDVFKREQGLVENSPVAVKTETPGPAAPPPPPAKVSTSKKTSSGKLILNYQPLTAGSATRGDSWPLIKVIVTSSGPVIMIIIAYLSMLIHTYS